MQHSAVVQPLSIASLIFCTAILVAYGVRVVRFGRARHERIGSAPGSALLPGWAVEAFYWVLQAPGRALARLGVSPDALTLLSLACSLASLPLIAIGRLPEGAICVAAGGVLDALDGLVARLRGRASAAGAVLDSVIDRVSDAAPFAGLAVFYRESAVAMLVPIAALIASSLLSYARAKADQHGLRLPNGVMRRHERIAYLVAALLLAPVVPRIAAAPAIPSPATLAIVALIAVAGFGAAIVLVERTRAALARPTSATPAAEQGTARSLGRAAP